MVHLPTPKQLKNRLELKKAKQFGYTTVKQAKAEGCDIACVSCTVMELRWAFNLTETSAKRQVASWIEDKAIKQFVDGENLGTIYFKN